MDETKQVIVKEFQGQKVRFRKDLGTLWVTGKEIGRALGYKDPSDSINLIYNAHSDEFDNDCTRIVRIEGQAGAPPVRVREYSVEGVTLLCMFSEQPAAKPFRKWARKVLTEVMTVGSYGVPGLGYRPPEGAAVLWFDMLSPSEQLRLVELRASIWMKLADRPRSRALWLAFYETWGGKAGYATYLHEVNGTAPTNKAEWLAFERDIEQPSCTPEEWCGDGKAEE